LVKHPNPRSPKAGEAFSKEDAVQGIPTYRVESFAKVKLENGSRSSTSMASLNNVGRIDEIFGDGSARDKPSLIRVHQEGDETPESKSKAFGVDF
jgi:hypothetical protein